MGDELGIPVYYYEAAATDPRRKNLADVRRGEYEGLAERLSDGYWQPDCGPAILVAFNVTLNTRDKAVAADVAFELRQLVAHAVPSYPKVIGQNVRRAGEFKFCWAIGWYVEEYARAQISMNLTNYHVTPPHLVPERARQLAADRGLAVTGSETVSMILCAALLESGKYYLARQGCSYDIPPIAILETAIDEMGLRDVQPFDVQRKVIGLA